MSERLGCLSDLQVFVTDQCSAPRICEITDIVSVQWNRKLDDVSEAQIELALSDPECCACLSDIEPWCHMLHIIRNGEIVWQGPITIITYGYEKVLIQARDILEFLKVTIPKGTFNTLTDTDPNTGAEITDLAKQIIELGFVDRKPCFIGNIVRTDLTVVDGKNQRPTLFSDTALSPDNGFNAFQGTIFDWLQILAENGLDYTVLGLTIVLSVENAALKPIGNLTDEHVIGEIEVSKNGYQMANRIYVRYTGDDNDTTCANQCDAYNDSISGPCPACTLNGNVQPCYTKPCPALAEDLNSINNTCYGPIERLLDNSEVGKLATAQQTANAYVRFGNIAPRTVNFPGGTKLGPDTPWGINDMIPGQRVNAVFTGLCLDTFQAYILQELQYSLDAGGDEEISVTLGPLNVLGNI